jgi:hypothetical protein
VSSTLPASDKCEQEHLCPLQALVGDFLWLVDLGAPDFNCHVCSQPARKHAQVISAQGLNPLFLYFALLHFISDAFSVEQLKFAML